MVIAPRVAVRWHGRLMLLWPRWAEDGAAGDDRPILEWLEGVLIAGRLGLVLAGGPGQEVDLGSYDLVLGTRRAVLAGPLPVFEATSHGHLATLG